MKVDAAGFRLGLIVWAASTALLVPFGPLVFGPDNRVPVALLAGLLVIATYFGILWFATRSLRRAGPFTVERAALLGVSLCLPGLVLDGMLYAVNAGRYPGLDGSASGAMTAALLLAYAAALLGALRAAH